MDWYFLKWGSTSAFSRICADMITYSTKFIVSTAFFLHKYTWGFDDCGTTFRTYFCNLITIFLLFCSRRFIRFIPLLTMLYLGWGNPWHCSIYSFFVLSSVDTNNVNIVARSEPFVFIFYLYILRLHLCSVNMRKFSFPRYSCVHCVIAVCDSLNSSMCVVRPFNMAVSICLFHAVERVKKIVLGTPGFEDFGFLIHFAHLRNAEIVIWCYLFIY